MSGANEKSLLVNQIYSYLILELGKIKIKIIILKFFRSNELGKYFKQSKKIIPLYFNYDQRIFRKYFSRKRFFIVKNRNQ